MYTSNKQKREFSDTNLHFFCWFFNWSLKFIRIIIRLKLTNYTTQNGWTQYKVHTYAQHGNWHAGWSRHTHGVQHAALIKRTMCSEKRWLYTYMLKALLKQQTELSSGDPSIELQTLHSVRSSQDSKELYVKFMCKAAKSCEIVSLHFSSQREENLHITLKVS